MWYSSVTFATTNNINITDFLELTSLFNYRDIFLESFAFASDFFPCACRRQSVQSRLHVTVLNGSMYGRRVIL